MLSSEIKLSRKNAKSCENSLLYFANFFAQFLIFSRIWILQKEVKTMLNFATIFFVTKFSQNKNCEIFEFSCKVKRIWKLKFEAGISIFIQNLIFTWESFRKFVTKVITIISSFLYRYFLSLLMSNMFTNCLQMTNIH